MRATRIVLIPVLILLISMGTAGATPIEKQYTNPNGVKYSVKYNRANEKIFIQIINPTEERQFGSFRIVFDGKYSMTKQLRVEPGEKRTFSFDLSEGIDLTRSNHSVKFNGGPEALWFNYTREIDSVTPDGYSAPKISDVSLERGALNGRNRTFINVTAQNPTGRGWLVVVRAHTMETTGYYGPIYMPPHGSGYDRIPLNERPGELVAGEVRMYEENFSSRDGAFDQVEVYGRSSGETQWRQEEYEVVTAPWEKDPYVYENESAYRDKVSPETAWESPVVWAVGAIVAVAGLVVLSRRW